MDLFKVGRFKKLAGIEQNEKIVFHSSESFNKSSPSPIHGVRSGLDSLCGNSHDAENRVDGTANGTVANIDNNGSRLVVMRSAFEIEE